MDFQYEQAVEVLRRTPPTLAALLRGLPTDLTTGTEGPDTWSAYDVVLHLLHGEEDNWNWIARARTILEYGEQRPLDPVDRTAGFEAPEKPTLDQLLTAFEQARTKNLATLDEWHLTPELLARRGTHAALGTVTLGQLLSAWVVHDLNHTGQIVEVMAHQFDEAVGPWRVFLSILTRPILTD